MAKVSLNKIIEENGREEDLCEKLRAALENGADPNEVDERGGTPLGKAADIPSTEAVSLLLEYGADIDLPAEMKRTPLYIAALFGRTEMVELLLEHGASVDCRAEIGPAMFNQRISPGKAGIMDILAGLKKALSAKSAPSETPIEAAARDGNSEIVRLLRDSGARLTLHAAIALRDYDAVKKLLADGVDINLPDATGIAPLGVAMELGDYEMIKLLLEKGADTESTCEEGLTPVEKAALGYLELSLEENKKIFELLDKHGAQMSLSALLAVGSLERIEKMIEEGADAVSSTDGFWNLTPLHFAAKWNRPDVAALLIEKGADVNASSMSYSTPLSYAKEAGADEVIRILKEHGAIEE